MRLDLPIGISDFREIREKKLTYIDKSGLLLEMIDRLGTKVFLFPRPRRFGKTLNLSMLRYFFEKQPEDLSHLFEGLVVWEAGEPYRAHFQRYPVIFITFRDIKATSFEACWARIQQKIVDLFREHRATLLDKGVLNPGEARDYQAVLDGTAKPTLYRCALEDLTKYLHRASGERTIVLLDGYDEPLQEGFTHGYSSLIVDFFWSFLTAGLKDNPHLERGVLTTILSIPLADSILGGLNHLAVCTLLSKAFSSCFGFTEPEVVSLLEKAGKRDKLEEARLWYDGYDFGGHVIYNPWSILNYLANEDEPPQPYWLNTSSNDLIKATLEKHGPRLQATFEALLRGDGFEMVLDENVILERVDQSDETLFSLLVFSGYLRAEKRPRGPLQLSAHRLTIPNQEVRLIYTNTFQEWFETRMRGHGADMHRLVESLLAKPGSPG